MSAQYWDYRFKFPLASLATALSALTALREMGLLTSTSDIPDNMLGEPRDAAGTVVAGNAAFYGRPGIAASSYVDPDLGSVEIPARGDPGCWYVAIRCTVDPLTLPVNPADYGLQTCDPAESAAVLGVWA